MWNPIHRLTQFFIDQERAGAKPERPARSLALSRQRRQAADQATKDAIWREEFRQLAIELGERIRKGDQAAIEFAIAFLGPNKDR